ncbi:MAG: sugar phosphate isomerase/epimerase [Anaerolineae bacterium]|nr:sugar phosphate isomerase/epimerase [Thermoflexales bacterium]MDW8406784.1 sugar phosphate isomerase/epimerase [Anaerolineae bacterium]
MAQFILSAFGDEIDNDLSKQLDALAELDIHHLELRGVWGVNVLDLDDTQVKQVKHMLDARGFRVSAIGSPIGKSFIDQPREYELQRLERAIQLAHALETPRVRVFSFYKPEGVSSWAGYRQEILDRIGQWTVRAEKAGITLLHENERDIYGDIPERCLDIHHAVTSPALRNVFDPANYVLCSVKPMAEAWPLLGELTQHVHVKDATFSDQSVRPAGEGDGDVPSLLQALVDQNYHGFLTLEPHLIFAGQYGGISGPDGMHMAAMALRKLIAQLPKQAEVR